MDSAKLLHLNRLDESTGHPSPLTLLGSPAITAKSSITRLSTFHELQPRGNPLVPVFRGLHRGEPDGLVLQGLVREEPGKHTQAFPCHQGLVPRLSWPHALARMGLAPAGNPPLVIVSRLRLPTAGINSSQNVFSLRRLSTPLKNGHWIPSEQQHYPWLQIPTILQ
jgi:hypothetical protein